MSIKYTDNTVEYKGKLSKAVQNFLIEASGEIESEARRTVRRRTGKTAGDYQTTVIENTAYIGSDNINAVYEEYGTGEYALNGDGRKTAWTYQDANTGKWYTTTGKTPTRPLFTAYTNNKSKIEKRMKEIIKEV